jgi:hypothetical protein
MSPELFLTGVLIGATQAIKKATIDKNTGESILPSWAIPIICAILGALAGTVGMYYGYARFAGIDPLTGFFIGLLASGGVALFTNAGEAFGKGLAKYQSVRVPVVNQNFVSSAIKQGDPIAPHARNESAGMEQAGQFGAYDPENHGKG